MNDWIANDLGKFPRNEKMATLEKEDFLFVHTDEPEEGETENRVYISETPHRRLAGLTAAGVSQLLLTTESMTVSRMDPYPDGNSIKERYLRRFLKVFTDCQDEWANRIRIMEIYDNGTFVLTIDNTDVHITPDLVRYSGINGSGGCSFGDDLDSPDKIVIAEKVGFGLNPRDTMELLNAVASIMQVLATP